MFQKSIVVPLSGAERPTMKKAAALQSITVIGIDISKSSFQLFGVDERGNCLLYTSDAADE